MQPQDFTGFRQMSSDIPGIQNENYLYKKIYLKLQGLKGQEEVGVSRSHMEIIAKYLGHNNFRELVEELESAIGDQLASLVGSYYCYVRANLEEGVVLRSPVRIYIRKSAALFELKGPSMSYSGEAMVEKGCLFITMRSKEGKVFHHIYKLGERIDPKVLQGTFVGVTTAFDPIGGRTILVRQEEAFGALSNKRINTASLKKSKHQEEKILGLYFDKYHNNNVATKKSATFGFDDLR